MTDNRNTILAVVLSGLVLIAWQYFYNVPQMEKQRAQSQTQAELAKPSPQAHARQRPRRNRVRRRRQRAATSRPRPHPSSAATPRLPPRPRVKIDTPRLTGSISLKGARIDDLSLVQFRETVDPNSPPIVLYSPSNTAHPYYAEFGWVPARGLDRANSRSDHDVAAGGLRQPVARQPGDAEI